MNPPPVGPDGERTVPALAAAITGGRLPAPLSSSQPQPRPNRSSQEEARVRVKNRRLEYLRRNPTYLESSDREFADVALYHTLIRSFQTPAERAAEAQDKGFGQVLEASILRNPEPLRKVDDDDIVEEEEEEDGEEDGGYNAESRGSNVPRRNPNGAHADGDDPDFNPDLDPDLGPDTAPGLLGRDTDDSIANLPPRDAARRHWHAFVRNWFVRGGAGDDGFDYLAVDDDSDYDTLARADAENAWFDGESPGWASEEDDGDGDDGGGGFRIRTGETGIQDF